MRDAASGTSYAQPRHAPIPAFDRTRDAEVPPARSAAARSDAAPPETEPAETEPAAPTRPGNGAAATDGASPPDPDGLMNPGKLLP